MTVRKFPLWLLFLAAISSSAVAGNRFFDFETNPELGSPGALFGGSSEWRPTGGVNDSGYLKVTDAMNDQRGAILIGDIDDGQLVDGFVISADLRVGGGTADPADGFSFNFASADDPAIINLVTAVSTGEQRNPAVAVNGYADVGNPGDANLPEEGTTTGIAIGFDEWFSGNCLTDECAGIEGGANSDGVDDVIGLSVRVDNVVLEQAELPTKNGAADDPTSLQTGPVEGPLDWANLTMSLEPGSHLLTIIWKDVIAFEEQVEWSPRAGALIFAGRTGGANANHHIDNLSVETFLVDVNPLLCDFDDNALCNVDDIDALMTEVAAGTNNADFDLTGDDVVDDADRDEWLGLAGTENGLAGPYLLGDSNLDRAVNAQDLNNLALAWLSDNVLWSSGNFTGSGTDAQDLNAMAINWNQEVAVAAANGAAVPEPSAVLLLLGGLLALTLRRRS